MSTSIKRLLVISIMLFSLSTLAIDPVECLAAVNELVECEGQNPPCRQQDIDAILFDIVIFCFL